MKFFSMFSGLGGFELGILGLKESWSCVGHSEIDKYANIIYQKHNKGVKNYGDATTIRSEDVEDFNLFVGGFPCQAFSVAGKRKGEMDTRGTLYHEVIRILKDKRPQYILLENVKGLLSQRHRLTFITIIKELTNLGYNVEWSVLNSSNYGLPQNRERIYITGYLGTHRTRTVFPIRANNEKDIIRVNKTTYSEIGYDIAYCIDANYHSRRQLIQVNQPQHSNDRVYNPEGVSPTLNTMQGGRRQPFILIKERVRRLTPLECERVMGIPDYYTEGVSNTQRYKMLGNSVCPKVITKILKSLLGGT